MSASKGIIHPDTGLFLEKPEYEAEQSHELAQGTAFPATPTELDLFYRLDTHEWYMFNGTEWVLLTAFTKILGLILTKVDSNLEGGQLTFEPADNDKVPFDINLDRFDGNIRFFRNDADADVTLITSNQFGAGGSVTFETPDLAWKETHCHVCNHEFTEGDKMCMVVKSILTREQDTHAMAVPICKTCFLAD